MVVLSALSIKKKRRMVLLVLLLVQITVAGVRADGLVEISWKFVLLPLLPVSVFSASALAFLLVYAMLLKYHYPHSFTIKKYTLLFLLTSMLGISSV
jgi:hypothetical protein